MGRLSLAVVAFLSAAVLLALVGTAQANGQQMGTIVVYKETEGGDGVFTFAGSPSPLPASFQIDTAINGGGGAQIFDVPAGTYTITEAGAAEFALQEIFAAGSASWTTNLVQREVTVTLEAPLYFAYVRFTDAKAEAEAEDLPVGGEVHDVDPVSLLMPYAAVLGLVGVAVAAAVSVALKRKRTATGFSALFLVFALFFASVAHAVPGRLEDWGTSGDDTQIQIGTENNDMIVQFGFAGKDTQYAAGSSGDDGIIQNGGFGDNSQSIQGGNGNDYTIQDGGGGNDDLVCDGGLGNDVIVLNGGNGDDYMAGMGSEENDYISLIGGPGNDELIADGGTGDDVVRIYAGSGTDTIEYDNPSDDVYIDGGNDVDAVTIGAVDESFTLYTGSGTVLYKFGSGVGGVITVVNVEQIKVVDPDGNILYQWP